MTELTIAVLAMAACVFGASSGAKLSSRRKYLAFRQGLSETALIPRRMLPAVSAGLAVRPAYRDTCYLRVLRRDVGANA